MEDSGEVLDESSSSPSSTLKNYPLTCKVLYSYKVLQALCGTQTPQEDVDLSERREFFVFRHLSPMN